MNETNEPPAIHVVQQPKSKRRTALGIGAALAIFFSSVTAFCCTCLPISLVGAEIGNFFTKGRPPMPKLVLASVFFYGAWVVGAIVAYFVGRTVFRYFDKSEIKQ